VSFKLPFWRRRLFRLRNILLCVMLMVLALPLGGLYFFRIYENELVQQTERELIAQAAALSASYRQLLRNLQTNGNPTDGFCKIAPKSRPMRELIRCRRMPLTRQSFRD